MRKKWLVIICVLALLFSTASALATAQPAQDTYGAVAYASVTKLTGNQNQLNISVSVNGKIVAEAAFTIANNAAGEYTVGGYKVYVKTSGNNKVDQCVITFAPQPAGDFIFNVVNPRPSRAPINATGLSTRLPADLSGKTIAVVANYDNSMAAIARALLAAVPAIGKIIYVSDMEVAAGQSPRPIEMEKPFVNMALRDFEAPANLDTVDGIIVGNGF